jgi:hypothetical protein
MAYDIYVVRTKEWSNAASAPITKQDVDALIESDPELKWSTTDYVEMSDHKGNTIRYDMMIWRGAPCFWWYRDQIQCSGADDAQRLKLARIARALNGYAVGDDGERYEIRENIFGREKLVTVAPDD